MMSDIESKYSIYIKNLYINHKSQYNKVNYLDNLNLSVRKNTISLIFSNNKIQRNLLINTIMGKEKISYGQILINDKLLYGIKGNKMNSNINVFNKNEIVSFTSKSYKEFDKIENTVGEYIYNIIEESKLVKNKIQKAIELKKSSNDLIMENIRDAKIGVKSIEEFVKLTTERQLKLRWKSNIEDDLNTIEEDISYNKLKVGELRKSKAWTKFFIFSKNIFLSEDLLYQKDKYKEYILNLMNMIKKAFYNEINDLDISENLNEIYKVDFYKVKDNEISSSLVPKVIIIIKNLISETLFNQNIKISDELGKKLSALHDLDFITDHQVYFKNFKRYWYKVLKENRNTDKDGKIFLDISTKKYRDIQQIYNNKLIIKERNNFPETRILLESIINKNIESYTKYNEDILLSLNSSLRKMNMKNNKYFDKQIKLDVSELKRIHRDNNQKVAYLKKILLIIEGLIDDKNVNFKFSKKIINGMTDFLVVNSNFYNRQIKYAKKRNNKFFEIKLVDINKEIINRKILIKKLILKRKTLVAKTISSSILDEYKIKNIKQTKEYNLNLEVITSSVDFKKEKKYLETLFNENLNMIKEKNEILQTEKLIRNENNLEVIKTLKFIELPENLIDSKVSTLDEISKAKLKMVEIFSKKPSILIISKFESKITGKQRKEFLILIKKFSDLFENKTTILLFTSNYELFKYLNDYSGILKEGKIIEYGNSKLMYDYPIHPFTKRVVNNELILHSNINYFWKFENFIRDLNDYSDFDFQLIKKNYWVYGSKLELNDYKQKVYIK